MKRIILSLSVTLIALLITIGTNSCMDTEPARGPAKSAHIYIFPTGQAGFCFPPSGGFVCDIVVWTQDANSSNPVQWRTYSRDESFFSAPGGNWGGLSSSRRTSIEIPQSGQFQINITLTAKTCQNGCCSRCSSTDPPWTGRPVFMGNSGMVENRSSYNIPLSQANCTCC